MLWLFSLKDCASSAKGIPVMILQLSLAPALRVIEMMVKPGGHHCLYQSRIQVCQAYKNEELFFKEWKQPGEKLSNTFKYSALYGEYYKYHLLDAETRILNIVKASVIL